MAFDALTISAIVVDLQDKLINGRIIKINQPERDEINLSIRGKNGNERLVISANASLPLMYLDNITKKENPMKAPDFCMVLRKYLQNGRIISIEQIEYDRIVEFTISHYDELGDLGEVTLVVELMGKYSNIILVSNDRVLESIKHINALISSVREVYPGTQYFRVNGDKKLFLNTRDFDMDSIKQIITASSKRLKNILVQNFSFISPLIAEEVCYRANIDSTLPASSLNEAELSRIIYSIVELSSSIDNKQFNFRIYYDNDKPLDFSVLPLRIYSNFKVVVFEDISELLMKYYLERNHFTRLRDRSASIRQVLATNIERIAKKLNLWELEMKDCEKRDKFKLYGELLLTYSYMVSPGVEKIECINYYTDEPVSIPIDDTKNAVENSQRYYEKYNKMKRTMAAVRDLISEAKEELSYLESIQESINNVQTQDDLLQIKLELSDLGYTKKSFVKGMKKIPKAKPHHYRDELGYQYYVGKNNYQNEVVTFEIATNSDWWFHVKDAPGSHVIVKVKPNCELPDEVYLRAAALAGYYSQIRDSDRVEVDYIQKKHLKKPRQKKPGMVIYHTNYSMNIKPSLDGLELLE